MERPLIRKSVLGRLDHIFEFEDVCYFYWKIELGIGKSKVGNFEVCLPFLKTDDYEPVKILREDANTRVLTRFHYHVLIYFNDPLLVNDEPIVDFFIGSHSPIVYAIKDKEFEFGSHGRFIGTDSRLIDKFTCLVSFYSVLLKTIINKNIKYSDYTNDYETISKKIDDNYVFNPDKCKFLIYLGKYPDKAELESIGYRIVD